MSWVLVVEDDDDVRDAICRTLDEQGYPALAARHGAEALDILGRGALPNLVLLDLMMPVMNGWAFRARQQADPRLAKIPVVVMSAAWRLEDMAIDQIDFLPKPLEYQELISCVERYLGRPTVRSSGAVEAELDISDSPVHHH